VRYQFDHVVIAIVSSEPLFGVVGMRFPGERDF